MTRPEAPFLADSDPTERTGRPRRLARCELRWGVCSRGALSGGNRSGVFDCVTAAGRAVVVKLAAHRFEAATEAAALEAWADTGAAVALLDFDYDNAALLLERVRPGTPPHPDDSAAAVEVAADLLGRLHVVPPPDSGFPYLPDIYDVMERWSVVDYRSKVPSAPGRAATALTHLPAARRVAMALSGSAPRPVLLHGDFCDKNLLLDATAYVAADPIVRIGDPCSDIGFFAASRAPVGDILDLAATLAVRLGQNPLRAQRWSAVWSVHHAAQGQRSDQEELEAFAGGADAKALLGA